MTRAQKRTRLIIGVVVGAVLMLVGIVVGAYLVKQNQDNRNQAWGGRRALPTPDWKYGVQKGRTTPPRIGY